MLCYNGFNDNDLYGNATDLYTIVEINGVFLSIKSTNPVFSSILCHLLAFQAASKRFRRVCVVRVSTAKRSARPSCPFRDTRSGKNPLKSPLVS